MKAISWGGWDPTTDACITGARGDGSALWLMPIQSPLTLAIAQGVILPHALDADPAKGHEILDQMISNVTDQVRQARRQGIDGIAYVLDGAYPAHSTPMQYGGYFLERDREILELAGDLKFNLVFVEGTEDVYLDTVSDLPAHAFGWRMKETQVTPEMMEFNRPGPFASFDGFGDITLRLHEEALV